jgi:formiminotetrahydrofolate cyclodeaminase
VEPSIRFRDLSIDTFVSRLASGEPVPGGGSAAAIAGCLAAGLVAMVSALSVGRPKYAEHAALQAEVGPAAHALVDRFLSLADDDARVYAGYVAAMKLPRETPEDQERRSTAMRQAARDSSVAPFETIKACIEVVTLAEALAGRSNRNASSDLVVACLLAVAAARSAAANVYINLPAIEDEPSAQALLAETEALVSEVDRMGDRTREIVRGGEPREPLTTERS